MTSLYWDNFVYFGMGPKKGPDGQLVITFPTGNKKIPGIAAEDIGKCAYGIFKKGDEFIGKTVTEVLGHEVRYNNVSPEAYRGSGFPGADSFGNHFQFLRDFEDYFSGARDPNFARSLNPSLQTFKMWLTQNKNAIPLEGGLTANYVNGPIRRRSESLVEASFECRTVDDGDRFSKWDQG